MRDIVAPCYASVRSACERSGLGGSTGLHGPCSTQTACREGAEVSSSRANCLDDHEVLLLALDLVHLHSFEKIVGGVAKNLRCLAAKAGREVANGHGSAVDFAVVTGKEEVHVLAVTNECLVDWASIGSADRGR